MVPSLLLVHFKAATALSKAHRPRHTAVTMPLPADGELGVGRARRFSLMFYKDESVTQPAWVFRSPGEVPNIGRERHISSYSAEGPTARREKQGIRNPAAGVIYSRLVSA